MGKMIYKDFDVMFSEMKKETVPFRVFGKVYEIPKRIPASIVLEMARREKDEALSNDFMFRSALKIFGDAALNEWCARPDFTIDMLGEMIKWAFRVINGADDQEIEEITEDDSGADTAKN